MRQLRLFFALWIALSGALAQGFDADEITHGLVKLEKKFIYLFDRRNHNRHAVKVTSPKLLPDRVYLIYDEDLHLWIFAKTDFGGKLPAPREALRPGTVTPGKIIGAELALQRFVLREDGTWMPSKEKEVYKIWVKSNPPVLKTYTYEKTPASAPETIQHIAPTRKAPQKPK